MTDTGNDTTNNITKKLDRYVNSITKRKGYIESDNEKRVFSSQGSNYVGILYEINIKGATLEGEKETNLFVKNIILADLLIFSVEDVYKRELFAYKELSPLFEQLQNDANIPKEVRYEMAYCYEESNNEAIILENLVKRGYKTYFRTQLISFEFAQQAVKELAKFHSLSFVIEYSNPEYFQEKIKSLNHHFKYEEVWKSFTQIMTTLSLEFLEKEVKEKFGERIFDKVNKIPWYANGQSCNVKTLCHGDYRHSNIMVKEVTDEPSKVIPVDYQMMHYGNPVLDLFYLIFWGTDRDFRKKHMQELKEHYYKNLKQFLNYFKMDAEKIYPKDEFDMQFKEKMDYGVMLATLYLPFLFPDEEAEPNLLKPENIMGKTNVNLYNGFEGRYRGIIDDFIEWGYLND